MALPWVGPRGPWPALVSPSSRLPTHLLASAQVLAGLLGRGHLFLQMLFRGCGQCLTSSRFSDENLSPAGCHSERPQDSAPRGSVQPDSSPSHHLLGDFGQIPARHGLALSPLPLCWPFERKCADRVIPGQPRTWAHPVWRDGEMEAVHQGHILQGEPSWRNRLDQEGLLINPVLKQLSSRE